MLDFTKNTILEPIWQKRYGRLRVLLYALTIAWALALVYGIIFPTISFNYSFASDAPVKNNTLLDPRDENNAPLEKGQLSKAKKFFVDAALLGNFSNANVNLTLKKNADISGAILTARKSYRAFLYPIGDPVGFRDGSLLFSKGDFYIISNGERRMFASQDLATELGFTPDMFLMVDEGELDYNKPGEAITETTYPAGTLFAIDGAYYQLNANLLNPFVSEGAFLSRYTAKTAVKKDKTFLNNFEIAEKQIGLADGTLAAIGISVSILSAGKSYPIFSPQIFEELGYDWNAVYPANSEEVGIYKKQKLFGQGATHPDGTIFKDAATENYYIIQNGQKRPLLGTHLIASYTTKIKPVLVDSASLENTASCVLKKASSIWSNTYTCAMPVAKISSEKGNDYQFFGQFNSEIAIEKIKLSFKTALTTANIINSLSHVKASAISTYTPK